MTSDEVLATLRQLATERAEFCTDDLWPMFTGEPANRNMIGRAFREAARQGWIVGTERFVKSSRPESKGRRVQVWTCVEPADTFAGWTS